MRLWTTYCAGENLDLATFKEFDFVLFTKLFAKVTMQGDGLLVEFPYLRFIPNKASARVIPVQGFIVPCDQILKALEQVRRYGQLGEADRIVVPLVRGNVHASNACARKPVKHELHLVRRHEPSPPMTFSVF